MTFKFREAGSGQGGVGPGALDFHPWLLAVIFLFLGAGALATRTGDPNCILRIHVQIEIEIA